MTTTQEPDVVEATAVEVYQGHEHPVTLFQTDDPVEVIEKATRVAESLKGVVVRCGLITNIQGKEHPRVEAWQTLGSMLGISPVKEWVRPRPWPDPVPEALRTQHKRGLTFGYEASYQAHRNGLVVGGGEAECVRTESHWANRDDFALRSMAQTRALAKALSSPLRWIMVLAGYEATPAEEMDGSGGGGQPRAHAPRPSARPAQDTERRASAKQRGMINARASAAGLSFGDLANIVLVATGNEERSMEEAAARHWLERALEQLPARAVDAVLRGIEVTQ